MNPWLKAWQERTFPDMTVEEPEVDWAEVQVLIEWAEAFDATVEGMPLEVWLSTLPPHQTVLH